MEGKGEKGKGGGGKNGDGGMRTRFFSNFLSLDSNRESQGSPPQGVSNNQTTLIELNSMKSRSFLTPEESRKFF
jgi:hypothetical protein